MPGRLRGVDLSVELANTYWHLFKVVTERKEEMKYLELVLATLEPLRTRGVEDSRLSQRWEMAS